MAALIEAGGVVDHAALFVTLWRVIGELRGLIDGRFELRAEPEVQPLARYANADDSARGELGSFCGAGVDRLVQAWIVRRGWMWRASRSMSRSIMGRRMRGWLS